MRNHTDNTILGVFQTLRMYAENRKNGMDAFDFTSVDGIAQTFTSDDWRQLIAVSSDAPEDAPYVLQLFRRQQEAGVAPEIDIPLRQDLLKILLESTPYRKPESLAVFENRIRGKSAWENAYIHEWSSWIDTYQWTATTLFTDPDDYFQVLGRLPSTSQKRRFWDLILVKSLIGDKEYFRPLRGNQSLLVEPFLFSLHLEATLKNQDALMAAEIVQTQQWITYGLGIIRNEVSSKLLFCHELLYAASNHPIFMTADAIIYPHESSPFEWNDDLRKEQLLICSYRKTHQALPCVRDNIDHLKSDPILAYIYEQWADPNSAMSNVFSSMCNVLNVDEVALNFIHSRGPLRDDALNRLSLIFDTMLDVARKDLQLTEPARTGALELDI